MRRLLALSACLLLGACNMVVTSQPLVAARPDAPQFRDGVWLSQQQADCRFDANAPIGRWPECAGGAVIRRGRFSDPNAGKPDSAPYVLSPGAPLLGQFDISDEGTHAFYYAAFEPTARDPQGRITGFRAWPVLCGPPTSKPQQPGPTFPGLTRLPGKQGANCTTRSLDAVRQAANRSRELGDLSTARWLRDGDH